MIAFPVPVFDGTPPWMGVLLVIGSAAVFVVLVWQTVRYFKKSGPDDRDG